MSRPLRNRVAPWGGIEANASRGTLFGNRGGRIHDAAQELGRRRWASKQWICCVLSFKGRAREVMGRGYTELFFLDDAVALAAGHRPCFECRRAEAMAFAAAWARVEGLETPPRAPEMDRALHAQRLAGPWRGSARDLPDGAMFRAGGDVLLRWKGRAAPWSWDGYGAAEALPRGEVEVFTPRASCGALAQGWRPRLHESAPD